jgi:P63C domain
MTSKQLDPSAGGKARAAKLPKERRAEIARGAASKRWADVKSKQESLPEAKWKGVLNLLGLEIPCYVLSPSEQRVIGRTNATEMLTGIKGGGDLEKYIGVQALRPFINVEEVIARMQEFRLPEVEGTGNQVKGLPTDLLIDVCNGFVAARDANDRYRIRAEGKGPLNPDTAAPIEDFVPLTPRQREMAINAGMFLSACAKVGLDALVDEATGYQYDRAVDALQVKLKAYLSDEMRKWEKTFPDELWIEFARLTNWKGTVTQRPKYWGKLVTELVYENLDEDVAQWLRENVPPPSHGRNWHQYLSENFGLRKLIEHIWMLIGVSRTFQPGEMPALRRRMAELKGRVPVQMTLYLPRL